MDAPPHKPSLPRTVHEWWRQNVAEVGRAATARQFLTELWGFLRDSTPEQRRRRYGDVEYDWDHRVDTTSATVGWRDRLLGVFHSPYQPTEPALFHEMLAAMNIAFEVFTFIDLGSGKGRTLLMASDYPFRRIVGIELLPDLHRVAEANLRKYKSEAQRCFQLQSCCADARHYVFPAEPVVLYLSNPLPRAGLAQVIENIERSFEEHPRQIRVLYHTPIHEDVLSARRWLTRAAGTHQFSLYENI
jgi:Histone methylation protein DOT1